MPGLLLPARPPACRAHRFPASASPSQLYSHTVPVDSAQSTSADRLDTEGRGAHHDKLQRPSSLFVPASMADPMVMQGHLPPPPPQRQASTVQEGATPVPNAAPSNQVPGHPSFRRCVGASHTSRATRKDAHTDDMFFTVNAPVALAK